VIKSLEHDEFLPQTRDEDIKCFAPHHNQQQEQPLTHGMLLLSLHANNTINYETFCFPTDKRLQL
ncbi:unnamed protein product, partial [Rotaria magnacalcarata]